MHYSGGNVRIIFFVFQKQYFHPLSCGFGRKISLKVVALYNFVFLSTALMFFSNDFLLFCRFARERENKVSDALFRLSKWPLYPYELDLR